MEFLLCWAYQVLGAAKLGCGHGVLSSRNFCALLLALLEMSGTANLMAGFNLIELDSLYDLHTH